jgi:hypothetical protein
MESARPIAGVDYPRTFQEMDGRRYGAIEDPSVTGRGVLVCKACNAKTSLTAGTVFQDTRKPLRMWFLAMWFCDQPEERRARSELAAVVGPGQLQAVRGLSAPDRVPG